MPKVNALGAQGVALGRNFKGDRREGCSHDVMASGGGADGGGGIGTLLLLNLFRDRLNLPASNGEKVTR